MADLKCGILGTAIGFTDGGGRRHKGLDPVQRGRNPPKHGLRERAAGQRWPGASR